MTQNNSWKKIEEDFDKLTDKYKKHAGEWHNVDCNFPEVDEVVCNCNLPKNKREIKSLLHSHFNSYVESIVPEEKKINIMTKINKETLVAVSYDRGWNGCRRQILDNHKQNI